MEAGQNSQMVDVSKAKNVKHRHSELQKMGGKKVQLVYPLCGSLQNNSVLPSKLTVDRATIRISHFSPSVKKKSFIYMQVLEDIENLLILLSFYMNSFIKQV